MIDELRPNCVVCLVLRRTALCLRGIAANICKPEPGTLWPIELLVECFLRLE